MSHRIIFDFSPDSNTEQWKIVDDIVMGGKSNGSFSLDEEGHGVFEGHVSLKNNGGFSSLQYAFNRMEVNPDQTIRIRLKGDGKAYQFRVKDKTSTSYSYSYDFETTGDWQTVVIKLNLMSPQYRGQKLKKPNFNKNQIEQVTFLIGNNEEQNFKLILDAITILD